MKTLSLLSYSTICNINSKTRSWMLCKDFKCISKEVILELCHDSTGRPPNKKMTRNKCKVTSQILNTQSQSAIAGKLFPKYNSQKWKVFSRGKFSTEASGRVMTLVCRTINRFHFKQFAKVSDVKSEICQTCTWLKLSANSINFEVREYTAIKQASPPRTARISLTISNYRISM